MLVVFSYILMLIGWTLVSAAVTGTGNSIVTLIGVCIGLFIFVVGTMKLRRDRRAASSKRRIVGWSMKITGILIGVCWVVGNFAIYGRTVDPMIQMGMGTVTFVFFLVGDWIVDDRFFAFRD